MSSSSQLDTLLLKFQDPFFAISFLTAATIIAAIIYARRSNDNTAIPLFVSEGNKRTRWIFDCINLTKEAYKKFHDRPFRIWTTEGIQIGIHPKYVEEIKMLPDHTLPSSVRHFLQGPYLWPIEQWKLDYPHLVVKNDMNKHLPKLFPGIVDVIAVNHPVEFPACNDWSPVKVFPRAVRLITRISTKVFVGNGLEQNEEWITISSSYSKNVFIASAKLRWFHPALRPISQYFIPDLRTVWHCNRRAKELIGPIVLRRKVLENSKEFDEPNDSIKWLRELIPEPDRSDPFLHGIMQLGIASVSVGSTSHLITNIIFNLATWPEYQAILKLEIEEVLKETDGEWTTNSMAQLKKMDSFMKESLRHDGHVTSTFHRMVRKPLNLSDGTHIPANTMIFTPAFAIANDPNIWKDPSTFDGLRFYHLRQRSAEDEKKFQFTTINQEQVQFGMGRHACSGRFLASYQIKLVIANLICRFEFKLKDGEGRPKNTVFQTNIHPALRGEVLFRNRK